MIEKKKSLFELPVASTDFVQEAEFKGAAIVFEYSINDEIFRGTIQFKGISAFRSRSERCCTEWHIEGAYDSLLEIENSTWVKEIISDTKKHLLTDRRYNHYMIYLDSAGCFEVIADDYEFIAEPY